MPTSSQVVLSVFDGFSYACPTDPTSPAAITPREHLGTAVLEVFEPPHLCRTLADLRTPEVVR